MRENENALRQLIYHVVGEFFEALVISHAIANACNKYGIAIIFNAMAVGKNTAININII